MTTHTQQRTWWQEMGAISRGMMFFEGVIAAPRALGDADARRAARQVARVRAADSMGSAAAGNRATGVPARPPGGTGVASAVLGAWLLFAAAAVHFASDYADTAPARRIVDLPAVLVHPAAGDLAYYQAHRIVDLPAVRVHPDPADLAGQA